MTLIAFPLDPSQPLSVFGRDDARVLRQRGLTVDVIALDHFGRPFNTSVPIERIRLAFGKRAGAGQSARLAPSPREEDRPFFTAVDAMGRDDRTPCA